MLVRVANTLALVRLWWTETTDLRSRLANSLLIDTFHNDLGLAGALGTDTLWQLIVNVFVVGVELAEFPLALAR